MTSLHVLKLHSHSKLTIFNSVLQDLINTLISMAFLGIVSIITMTTENSEKNLTFIGGVSRGLHDSI